MNLIQTVLLFLTGSSIALAPLEQPDNSGVFFGTWVDRLNGDSANATNQRLDYKKMSLFQGDVNLTATVQLDLMDDIFNQIAVTKTDAIVYLTVYPFQGFSVITDSAISQLANKVGGWTKNGTRVFIRYASEMNGAWFSYGQQPTAFLESWRKVVSAIRAASQRENIAFIWAPNSGNGYPFPSIEYSAAPGTLHWDPALDTNNDGRYDINDDPYSPFYPGDEWVDWVGMSTYSYGAQWISQNGNTPSGWITNDVPDAHRVQNILTGENGWGRYNFYEMYCGSGRGGNPVSKSSGGKPFIITETAATIHMAILMLDNSWYAPANSDPESRVAIKRAWWAQMLNADFLRRFSKIKAISFFEFIKFEERSWRDFTTLGGYGILSSPLGNDGASKDQLVLRAFQQDLKNGMGDLIIWANETGFPTKIAASTSAANTSSASGTSTNVDFLPLIISCLIGSVSYWTALF